MIGEGIDLSGEHERKSGALRDFNGKMRPFLLANPAHPQQVILLLRHEWELLDLDPVVNHANHVFDVAEGITLRIGNAIQVQIGRNVAERLSGIKMTWQMQGRENGDITLGRTAPEAAALVVNQVECGIVA